MFNPQFGSNVARLIDVPVECNIIHTANMEPLENKRNLFDGKAKKERGKGRKKKIILNKQIPSLLICTLQRFPALTIDQSDLCGRKKQTHLIFFLLL